MDDRKSFRVEDMLWPRVEERALHCRYEASVELHDVMSGWILTLSTLPEGF